ncbi:MAG: hypothetical protein QXQ40_00920 [Candidatus Aenigmatarchaeota archaeon]
MIKIKVSIIGPRTITRTCEFARIKQDNLMRLIDGVGRVLAKHGFEIVIIPNAGVSYLVSKTYKAHKGKKVIGLMPKNPEPFGIEHQKLHLDIVDEIKELPDWYHVAGRLVIESDFTICIGLSGGTMMTLCWAKWYSTCLNQERKIVIFENTISRRLHPELEAIIRAVYVNSIDELDYLIDSTFWLSPMDFVRSLQLQFERNKEYRDLKMVKKRK